MITASDLFGYQGEALNLIMKAFETKNKALVVMATGLGKTIVAAFWAKSELKKKRKGLFLCHDNGILEQATEEFRKVMGDKAKLCSFFGNDKDFDADKSDIVFASFQTYANWKNAFFEDEFDFIIVDESHHGQAPTFKEVIQYFKPKKLLGITATPNREDMKDIREIFGKEVVNYPLEEAIAKGWLTQVEYRILNDNLNHWKLKKIIRGILEEGQCVSVKQINESIFIEKRDEEIARTIQEYASSSKKAIIFCEKIEHAENFQSHLPGSLTYHSKVKGGRKENRKRLDAFREGSLQYILAVNKFNEGIDVPDAELIVFLRCTDSKTIFFQQLGRGLRKIFGKEKVIVLDFVANCERLAMVKEMAHRVKEFAGNNFILNKESLHVSGSAFDFCFSDDQIDILEIIKRIECRFVADFPNLLAEYSNENILPPEQAAAGSHRKYLWKCSKCSHEWWAQGQSRLIQKTGCPACAGKVPKPSEYLVNANTTLAAKYSASNPIPLKEVTVTKNFLDKFLWNCSKCKRDYEEYLFTILDEKVICPECICKAEEKTKEIRKNKAAERRKKYYATEQECLEAALKANAYSWKSYYCVARKVDPMLPPFPNSFYDCDEYSFFERLNEFFKNRKTDK